MHTITNLSKGIRVVQAKRLKGEGVRPVTLRPGESVSLTLANADSPFIRGLVEAQELRLETEAKGAKADDKQSGGGQSGGDDATALKAVHRGGPRFSVMRGDEEVKAGLTKADADAFNALSDEDKAAFVVKD